MQGLKRSAMWGAVAVLAISMMGADSCGSSSATTKTTADELPTAVPTDVVADDTSTPIPTQAPPAGVGDSITLHGTESDLAVKVKLLGLIDAQDAYDGTKYIGVRLALKNVGSAVYSDSPGNGASLIIGAGRQADATISTGSGCEGLDGSVKISPGDKRVGCIPFEVARGKPRLFQMTLDSGFADETGEWHLR